MIPDKNKFSEQVKHLTDQENWSDKENDANKCLITELHPLDSGSFHYILCVLTTSLGQHHAVNQHQNGLSSL